MGGLASWPARWGARLREGGLTDDPIAWSDASSWARMAAYADAVRSDPRHAARAVTPAVAERTRHGGALRQPQPMHGASSDANDAVHPGDSATPLLQVDNVSLEYRTPDHVVQATQGVSFQVHEAERFVLLGPSGCGKSTLLKAAAGFLQPREGAIRLDGREVRGPGPDRVVVFQEFRSGSACLNSLPRFLSGFRAGCQRCRVVHSGGRHLRRTHAAAGNSGRTSDLHLTRPASLLAGRRSTLHRA